jgi:hypothetical protein
MRYTTEIQNRLLTVRSTVLEIEKEQIKNKHEEFQSIHLERQGDIEQLHYNGHKCWADLVILYLEEAVNRTIPIEATIDQYLHGRAGVR